jgi:hypothetical protein
MYLWMPVVTWGTVRLLSALIESWTRISYERARAASIADVLRAIPAGGSMRERRLDGTVLCIDVPCQVGPCNAGLHKRAGGEPC